MKINVDVVKDQLDKTLSGQFLTRIGLATPYGEFTGLWTYSIRSRPDINQFFNSFTLLGRIKIKNNYTANLTNLKKFFCCLIAFNTIIIIIFIFFWIQISNSYTVCKLDFSQLSNEHQDEFDKSKKQQEQILEEIVPKMDMEAIKLGDVYKLENLIELEVVNCLKEEAINVLKTNPHDALYVYPKNQIRVQNMKIIIIYSTASNRCFYPI